MFIPKTPVLKNGVQAGETILHLVGLVVNEVRVLVRENNHVGVDIVDDQAARGLLEHEKVQGKKLPPKSCRSRS